MIAFFLTMPISSTMPISAITLKSLPEHEQRQQRAHAGRRQRRENRDRMDVALVQNAQHDVHRDQRRENQQRLVGQRAWNAAAVPWKAACMLGGKPHLLLGLVDRVHRVAQRRVRCQIERNRGRRKLALVGDQDGRGWTARSG